MRLEALHTMQEIPSSWVSMVRKVATYVCLSSYGFPCNKSVIGILLSSYDSALGDTPLA